MAEWLQGQELWIAAVLLTGAVVALRAKKKEKVFKFTCSQCLKVHEGFPALSQLKPLLYFDIPEDERNERVDLSGDFCSIDNKYYYIRASLDISVQGYAEPLNYGLWVSQSKDSYEQYQKYVGGEHDDSADNGSFGWITVDMWGFKRTQKGEYLENLECDIEWNDRGHKARIVLHESDHPLYLAQRDGVSPKKAKELVEHLLHR